MTEPTATARGEKPKKARKANGTSQATQLVKLAEQHYELAMSPSGEPFAIPKHGARIARLLRGGRHSARAELAARYSEAHRGKAVASASALADALVTLEGHARARTQDLHTRVAETTDGELVIDLGDDTGRAVVVAEAGWEIVAQSPLLFRRTELTGALPVPERGGNLDELWSFVNVAVESRPLALGWIVATYFPSIAHPILLLAGEQGVGKSTTARRLVALTDPSPVPLRSGPRDLEQWAVAAAGSWVVAIDNLSYIPQWFSDALCRAATGDGLIRRRLYSDDGLAILSFRRCPILTSIDVGALRGDLGDRLVAVDLERIDSRDRKTDRDLDSDWQSAYPRIFGSVLDLLVDVVATHRTVAVKQLPRLADFGRILAALDATHGLGAIDAYRNLDGRIAADVVDGDPVATSIRGYVSGLLDGWSGTASALLDAITPETGRRPKDWPRSPQALAGELRRVAPALRLLGFEVNIGHREGGTGRRIITIEETRTTSSHRHSRHNTAPDPDKCRDEARDERVTSPAGSSHPSSHPRTLPDQDKRAECDERDDVTTSNGSPLETCIDCGEPFDWLSVDERCETCFEKSR